MTNFSERTSTSYATTADAAHATTVITVLFFSINHFKKIGRN